MEMEANAPFARTAWRLGSLDLVRKTIDFQWFKVKWLPRYGWTLDRRAAIVVIAFDPDDRLWLENIHRVPRNRASWEMPGGMIDDGEDAVAAGLRELEEECGLVAKGRVRLHPRTLEIAPGMGKFPHQIVVAKNVVPKGRRAVAQKEEGILAVKAFDRTAVKRMVKTGKVDVMATLGPLVVSGWLDG